MSAPRHARTEERGPDPKRVGPHRSEIAGESSATQALRRQIETLGRLKHELPPVLVTGETGVGKGVVARALHEARFGPDAPMIDVSCAALPATLIEAELFGHEKSAFTDAREAKPGLFEAAAGGTLFLDEIGELSLPLQAKLLTAVESRRARRLGSVQDYSIDCAIVCATNVDLPVAVTRGEFRVDLYHRIAAQMIAVPPLRDRPEDILLLARLFLARSRERYGRHVSGLSLQAEQALLDWTWPGNVRELLYTVDRAVLACPEDVALIAAEHLKLPARTALGPTGANGTTHEAEGSAKRARIVCRPGDEVEVELPEEGIAFSAIERAVLSAALQQTAGNVVRAAKLLGLKRDALRYRIRKLKISNLAEEESDASERDTLDLTLAEQSLA